MENQALVSLVRAAFSRTLNFHEGFCLAHILRDFSFTFDHGVAIGPLDNAEIAEVLEVLAVPCEQENSDEKSSESITVCELSSAARWQSYLDKEFQTDAPLTNHDRNTMLRLLDGLRSRKELWSLIHVNDTELITG